MEIEESKELIEVRENVSAIVVQAGAVVIASAQDVEDASGILKSLAGAKKSLTAMRLFFVKPLNDQVSKINDMFKAIAAPAEEADVIVRGKILAYRQEVAERERKEQERLNRLAEARMERAEKKAEETGAPVPAPIIPSVVSYQDKTIGSVTARKVWSYRIVDEAKVPREYLIVEPTLVRKAVREGARDIPGIEIFEEEQLAVR
jgi:hypothetical protein